MNAVAPEATLPDAPVLVTAEDDAAVVRRLVLNVRGAFHALQPVLVDTRRLGLNVEAVTARLGGAGRAFNTACRELRPIADTLQQLLTELNTIFAALTRQIGASVTAEGTRRLWERCIDDALQIRGQPPVGAWPDPMSDGEALQLRLQEVLPVGLGALVQRWKEERNRERAALEEVLDLVRRLQVLVDRMQWVAVRQAQYLVVVANVEAVRIERGSEEATAVAGQIRELMENVARVEGRARDRLTDIRNRAARLSRRMRPWETQA
jgi:hypothetical protein